MRSRRAHLTIGLLLLTAVGCGSGGGSSSTPTAAAPTTTAPPLPTTTTVVPKSTVVLDSPGAQPRQSLVLRMTAGSSAKVAMVSKVGIKMTIDGEAAPLGVLPATRTVMEQRVDRVDADGTAHFSVRFPEVSAMATPGGDPAAVKAVEDALQSLKGVTGAGAVDVHGNVSDMAFDTRSVSDPNLKSTLDSLSSQLGSLSAPFPTEPVGVGARWTVTSTATITGLKMTTTTHFTLRSRTGDRYELDQAQDAVGLPGPAAFPGLPAGAEASVTKFTVKSTGQISGDLTRQMPIKSSTKGTGDGTFAMTVNGEELTMGQKLTMDIT
jgi:hypothetical protein